MALDALFEKLSRDRMAKDVGGHWRQVGIANVFLDERTDGLFGESVSISIDEEVIGLDVEGRTDFGVCAQGAGDGQGLQGACRAGWQQGC